jgi:hypothetical protein
LNDVTDALWVRGVSLQPQAGGYRLNYRSGGTPQTEFNTDDLIDALVTGLAMAEHPPSPPRRPKRRRTGRYRLGTHGELRRRPKGRRRR